MCFLACLIPSLCFLNVVLLHLFFSFPVIVYTHNQHGNKRKKSSRFDVSDKRQNKTQRTTPKHLHTHRHKMPHVGYFDANSKLDENSQKYCACVNHVSADNTRECNRLGQSSSSSTSASRCYNPYAVCTAVLQPGPQRPTVCLPYTNLENLPDDEVQAWYDIKRLSPADETNANIMRLQLFGLLPPGNIRPSELQAMCKIFSTETTPTTTIPTTIPDELTKYFQSECKL